MKCPVCQTATFVTQKLGDELLVAACQTCGGYWLKSFHYWLWKEKHADATPETPGSGSIEAREPRVTKTCPECFKILSSYVVGHGTPFSIDRCETCRGIWFDKSEWEILKSKNLHDEIHFIFSSSWQKQVRESKELQNRAQALARDIGDEDFRRVEQFSAWLVKHPKARVILPYLNRMLLKV